MTFPIVGVTVHGVTAMLADEGARPQSLVTGMVIFLPAKTLTQGNPQMDLHTHIFPGLTIHTLKLHDRRNNSHFKHFNNIYSYSNYKYTVVNAYTCTQFN